MMMWYVIVQDRQVVAWVAQVGNTPDWGEVDEVDEVEACIPSVVEDEEDTSP